jgi:hypothetical protein
MNTLTRQGRITGSLQGLGASWWSVGLFAVVLSFANGFIVASMQWTVGAIERLSPPFEHWMFNSVVMIPVYAIAIIGALYLARRLAGSGSGKVKKLRIGMGASLDPRCSGVNGAPGRVKEAPGRTPDGGRSRCPCPECAIPGPGENSPGRRAKCRAGRARTHTRATGARTPTRPPPANTPRPPRATSPARR